MKVLFVCESNLIRSPISAALFVKLGSEMGVPVNGHSAGSFSGPLARKAERRAREAALRRGLSLDSHRTREFSPAELTEYDYVIALDDDSYWRLEPHIQNNENKLFMLGEFLSDSSVTEVPDPLEHDIELVELFALLSKAITNLLLRIKPKSS